MVDSQNSAYAANQANYFEIRNLCFFYQEKAILDKINVALHQNQITTLIGPSGSGKSTLLRTFNRIYELYPGQKATGEIFFEKQNILDKNIDINQLRKRIGMVFQKPTPFPMSIYDNIAFALKVHEKLDKNRIYERVKEALIQAALWDEVKDQLKQSGTSLSGGQQQRLCIARTLAIKPDILLLDEPTASLDPISTNKIETLLAELKKQYTIFMVTHDLKQAHRVGDYTMLMMDGRIVEKAKTEHFFHNPQDERTRNYIQSL